jgi:hypothetical protein
MNRYLDRRLHHVGRIRQNRNGGGWIMNMADVRRKVTLRLSAMIDSHHVTASGELPHHVRADELGPADHDDVHDRILAERCTSHARVGIVATAVCVLPSRRAASDDPRLTLPQG